MIWVALGSVYVIWGTTYLGIRITNETLPPLIAAGTRFVIAGAHPVRRLHHDGGTPRPIRSAGRSGGRPSSWEPV